MIKAIVRRKPFLILSLLCLFPIIPAQGATDREPVVINLGSEVRLDDPRSLSEKIGKEIFVKFKEKYPDYKYKMTESLRLTNQLTMDALIMSIAGGTAPDIIPIPFRNSSSFVEQDFLCPLDEYYEQWKKEVDINEFVHPNIWPVITHQGHIWFLPYEPIAHALLYRRDLLRKAGLNRPPNTWDELFEWSQRLTRPEENQYGYGIFGQVGNPSSWHWMNFIWQAGGEIFKKDESGRWLAAFNDEGGVAALRFYRRLLREPWERDGKKYTGVAKVVHYTLWDEFNEGKIAMVISSVSDMLFQPDMNPELISIAPLPLGPTGIRANMMNATLMGINNTITSKAHRDAVWNYMKFIRSPVGEYISVKNYVEAGFGKFLPPKKLRKYGFERYIKNIPEEWLNTYDVAMANGRPEPYQPGCNVIYTELQPALQKAALYDTLDYKQVLDEVAHQVNKRILGRVPPEVMQKRRLIALIAVIIIGAVFVFLFIRVVKNVMTMARASVKTIGESISHNKYIHIWAWCLMLPAILTILVWQYYPLARGIVIAFMDYRVIGQSKWVGLDNFITAFWQPNFWISIKNTILYVGLSIIIGFLAPIILALLLNEVPRGSLLFRVIYYLPAVTSTLVVTLLWMRFYDPTAEGFFNQLLRFLGLPEQIWLQNPKMAMVLIIIPGVWSGVGASSIFYLAALKNIPEELYEAADIDGAGIFRKIWNVTFSTLRPLIIIQFVGAVIGAFQATQRILVMTAGGPLKATHTMGLEIFFNAFTYMKYGYATAVAWIMGSMIIGFTVFQLRILRTVRFEARGAKQ